MNYEAWTTEELDRLRVMLAVEGAGPEETDAVARELRRRESAATPALGAGQTPTAATTSSRVLRVELNANVVLKEAWRLYKRLFARSVVIGAVVFGALHFLEALTRTGRSGVVVALLTLVLAVAGVAFVQGALVEIVRGLHTDGDDHASLADVIGRASGRIGKLVCISLLTSLGIGLGFLLLVVPAFILMSRWAVSVPVAMLEEGNARDALRRSREIVRGNGWNVFKVLFAVGFLTAVAQIPFGIAARGAGPFGWWVATTLASALTAPYAAHALTVVYYALLEPERPVVLEPGQRWQSVWREQDAATTAA